MTREQLDAIRARARSIEANKPRNDVWLFVRQDVPVLLAEVERLREAHAMAVQVSGELCEKCGWAMKFPGEKCRCELLAEVERLTGERDEAFRSREEARAYRDISEQALREESERHAATRSRVQAALVVLWERGRIARGMRAATAGTALADAVTEVFDRLDRARGAIERLHADPLPAAAWVREVERAAFSRGVAAMREAAASHFSVGAPYDYIAPRIRALPDPEDTE